MAKKLNKQLNYIIKIIMKTYILFLFFIIIIVNSLYAQEISLQFCYEKAISCSPYQKLKPLYVEQANIEMSVTNKTYFPQFSLDGSATYQSEVFKIPVNIPGFSMPEIPYDQYQLSLTINQTIYDGGSGSAAKYKAIASREVNIKNVDVSLYKLKEQVNQLYFSVLVLQENEKLQNIVLNDLENKAKQLESLVKNGVILKATLNKINIEILKIQQSIAIIQSDIKGVLSVLSKLIDYDLTYAHFQIPDIPEISYEDSINREEIEFLELRKKELEKSKEILSTQLLPKVSAFVRGGWGQPNPMNIFETGFEPFYIAGLKLQWTPFDWNCIALKKDNITINQLIVDTDKENFEKNLRMAIEKEKSDIIKYSQLLKTDEAIIKSQKEIADVAYSQLMNGAITATEYIIEMDELIKAQQNFEMHKLQLIFSRINLLNKQGLY